MEGRGMTEEKLARYRSTGVFFVMLSVVVVTALATLAVTLRAALNSGDDTANTTPVDASQVDSYGLHDDQVQLFQVDGANDFEFVIAYAVELSLNYFFYYPVIGTILFSGILTCGRYPVWGGRPFELKEEAELAALEEGHEVILGSGGGGMNNSKNSTNRKSAKIVSDVEQPSVSNKISNKKTINRK